MTVRRTAVILIDLENQTDLDLAALRGHLRGRFYLVDQLAFADYSRPSMRPAADRVAAAGVTRVQVDTCQPEEAAVATAAGGAAGYARNAVDQVMARILDRLAGYEHIDAIIVVSGDNYFVRPVKRARRMGKRVIVAANPDRASRQLQNAANEFISLYGHKVQ
ncbi:MAG: hypothetical protein Kow0063_11410 [Anaerolineae bacterium]